MRIIFIGTGRISVSTAHSLLKAGHEVVFIEKNKDRIEELSNDMDCGFMHGDGSTPAVLEEVGPKQSDYLFCLTGNDKDNIIAGLVGRSQGFPKVIIKVEDFALEHICAELGLEDVIVPTRTISRYLSDMISGHDVSELSTAIRGEARFFSFIVNEEYAQKIGELEQPSRSKIICFYRDGDFHLADPDTLLQVDDEVVILTYRDTVDTLKKKWPSVSQEKEENKLKS
jgi:trk system potassium uptake protein TrkA